MRIRTSRNRLGGVRGLYRRLKTWARTDKPGLLSKLVPEYRVVAVCSITLVSLHQLFNDICTYGKHYHNIVLALYHDAQVELHLKAFESFVDEDILDRACWNEPRRARPQIARATGARLHPQSTNDQQRLLGIALSKDEPRNSGANEHSPKEREIRDQECRKLARGRREDCILKPCQSM